MSWTSLVASVDSASGSSEPGCEPLPSLKSTTSAAGGCGSSGPVSRSMVTSASSRQISFLDATSSAAGSPAKTSARRDRHLRLDSAATDPGCGAKCSGSCESADPIGCLLRMSLASELSAQTGFSVTWKTQATPGGRSWYVLKTSEPRIRAREFGSLPTPTASAYGSNQGGAAGRVGPRRYSLRKMMLTPTETANLLCDSMQKWPGARAFRQLVSRFGSGKPALFRATRWLMGYPTTWMQQSLPSETQSSHTSRICSDERS